MKTVTRDKVTSFHSRFNELQFTVRPGEVFMAETELCTGSWLTSLQDTWTPDKSSTANPTVCVAVESAMPSDMLAVHIIKILPGSMGYTGFDMAMNPLARCVTGSDWALTTKTVEIRDGLIHWGEGLNPVREPNAHLYLLDAKAVLTETMINEMPSCFFAIYALSFFVLFGKIHQRTILRCGFGR